MDFNLKCDNFKKSLIKLINDNDLPIAVVYSICENIFTQVEKVYMATINQIILKQQKEGLEQFEKELSTEAKSGSEVKKQSRLQEQENKQNNEEE